MSPDRNIRAEILKAAKTSRAGVDAIVSGLEGELGDAILESIELIASKSGRLVITGVGKSGHVGAKTAATFASTGTPAQFVHATEASHGDLGMITTMIVCWQFRTPARPKNCRMFSTTPGVSTFR